MRSRLWRPQSSALARGVIRPFGNAANSENKESDFTETKLSYLFQKSLETVGPGFLDRIRSAVVLLWIRKEPP
jgi:hypothetical protein